MRDEVSRERIFIDWFDIPYIDYLNAVDDVLETITGTPSHQKELEIIASAQESNQSPEETAEDIINGRKSFLDFQI